VALLGQKYPRYTYSSATALPTPVTALTVLALTADIGPASVIYTPPAQAVIDLVSTSPSPGQVPQRANRWQFGGEPHDWKHFVRGHHLVPATYHVVAAMDTATTAERKAAIAGLTNKDLLPTITITSANAKDAAVTQPLMADTDCYLQSKTPRMACK
jgi:hypothetical protein